MYSRCSTRSSLKHLLIICLFLYPAMLPASAAFTASALDDPEDTFHLRTEHLENPLGIDALQPRLSWRMTSDKPGAAQNAYRLIVGTDSSAVVAGEGVSWDTDKQQGKGTLHAYDGQGLEPFTRYFWKVFLWDEQDNVLPASGVAAFETGMLSADNWNGNWISDGYDIAKKEAPYFRKSFSAKKKIKSARAYIAAGGLYELSLNGRKVGDHRLDPVYTRFDRRNLYVTYDVTSYLQNEENTIGVLLGNGWYNHQSTAVWFFDKAPWRSRPRFCLDLRITYEDGTVELVTSDLSWKTELSPVIFNSIYTAEHYDARKEQAGWDSNGFIDTAWKAVKPMTAPSRQIVAQAMHPIRDVRTYQPVSVNRINDTSYVFDFGQNMSGVTELKLSGEAGTVVRLKHGERLREDGHVDLSNIDQHYRPTDDSDPFQVDIVILGEGETNFRPRFNYKGFQYVEVTADKPFQIGKDNLTAFFMHSDVPAIGKISSSNPVLNKVWEATNNAYLSNLFGYPTDCPQREKNGWTGDAHIAVETGLYNYDGITVYEKWLADHRDEQQPNGVLPSIIPTGGWGYEWGNGPDWTSTIALIPWNVYVFSGDDRLLKDNYQALKRYVEYIRRTYGDELTTWGLGDWVPVKSKSPVELTSSVYYYVDALILSKSAALFGHDEDAETYRKVAESVKEAINRKYFKAAEGIYGSGLQTELSMPLYWGIVPEESKSKVAAALAKRVEQDNFHIDVGLLGTKAILNALSEHGYPDVAYKVAAQEDYPSWGWWIKNGATTLYENWNIESAHDISLNHIMFGEIGAWMYKGLGGIFPDEQHPGFERVILKPHVVEDLDNFECEHEGPRGTIRSSWQKKGKRVNLAVLIPANSSGLLELPELKGKSWYKKGEKQSGQSLELQAGLHEFESR